MKFISLFKEGERQKLEEVSAKEEEYRGMLEDLYGQVLAVQEEVEMAGCEGSNVTKPKGRMTGLKVCIRRRRHHLRGKNTQQ